MSSTGIWLILLISDPAAMGSLSGVPDTTQARLPEKNNFKGKLTMKIKKTVLLAMGLVLGFGCKEVTNEDDKIAEDLEGEWRFKDVEWDEDQMYVFNQNGTCQKIYAYKENDTYSQRYFGRGIIGTPTSVLFPKEKLIVPFKNAELAVRFMQTYEKNS